MKSHFYGTPFADDESLKAVVEAWFDRQDREFFSQGINSLAEKWQNALMLLETTLKNENKFESLWLFFISKLQNFLNAPRIRKNTLTIIIC